MTGEHWTIFANGEWCKHTLVEEHCTASDVTVACDGALEKCLQAKITPDLVIGDLDSVLQPFLDTYKRQGGKVIHEPSQERNDLQKALEHAMNNGAKSCTVIGATGGDPQHEWGNLLACAAVNFDIVCYSKQAVFHFPSPGTPYSIEIIPGRMFSLFALAEAHEINLSGARFDLADDQLSIGSRGVHNVAQDSTINLHYTSGRLMVLVPNVPSAEEGGV